MVSDQRMKGGAVCLIVMALLLGMAVLSENPFAGTGHAPTIVRASDPAFDLYIQSDVLAPGEHLFFSIVPKEHIEGFVKLSWITKDGNDEILMIDSDMVHWDGKISEQVKVNLEPGDYDLVVHVEAEEIFVNKIVKFKVL